MGGGPMEEVGRLLRQAREDLGLSLAEVEARTKIRSRYLLALEEGQYDVLPGKVYALGFLRNYAEFLGLDVELILSQVKDRLPDENHLQLGEDQLPSSDQPLRRFYLGTGFLKVAIGLLLVLLVFKGIYHVLPSKQGNGGADPSGSIVEEQKTGEEAKGPEVELPIIEPQAEEKLEVAIQVKDEQGARCWVEVRADGERIYAGTLERAEQKVFTAEEKIKITLGNAGAVAVTYNGEEFGSPGKKGEVVSLEFPRE